MPIVFPSLPQARMKELYLDFVIWRMSILRLPCMRVVSWKRFSNVRLASPLEGKRAGALEHGVHVGTGHVSHPYKYALTCAHVRAGAHVRARCCAEYRGSEPLAYSLNASREPRLIVLLII